MKHYNIIKTAVILILLLQVFSVIGQLGLLVSSLTYFEGSLNEIYGLGIGLLFILVFFGVVYYCITKVDSILRFFKIDTLFEEDDRVELGEISANWISLILITIGMFFTIPTILSLLQDGLTFMKLKTHSNGLDSLIHQGDFNRIEFIQDLLELALGITLITQSKYLGKWISKKVIEDVKIEE